MSAAISLFVMVSLSVYMDDPAVISGYLLRAAGLPACPGRDLLRIQHGIFQLRCVKIFQRLKYGAL